MPDNAMTTDRISMAYFDRFLQRIKFKMFHPVGQIKTPFHILLHLISQDLTPSISLCPVNPCTAHLEWIAADVGGL